MKTKTIVAIICIIAMSSCNVFNERPRFKYLNKIAADSPNRGLENNSNRESNKIEKATAICEQIQIFEDSNCINIQEEINTNLNSDVTPKQQVFCTDFKKVNIPNHVLKFRNSNCCSLSRNSKKSEVGGKIILWLIAIGTLLIIINWITGLGELGLLLLIASPILLIALIIVLIISAADQAEKRKPTIDNSSAFVESKEKPKKTSTPVKEKQHKKFPYGWVAFGVLMLALIPLIGGILLLAALVIAVLAGSVALGLYIYNQLSTKK